MLFIENILFHVLYIYLIFVLPFCRFIVLLLVVIVRAVYCAPIVRHFSNFEWLSFYWQSVFRFGWRSHFSRKIHFSMLFLFESRILCDTAKCHTLNVWYILSSWIKSNGSRNKVHVIAGKYQSIGCRGVLPSRSVCVQIEFAFVSVWNWNLPHLFNRPFKHYPWLLLLLLCGKCIYLMWPFGGLCHDRFVRWSYIAKLVSQSARQPTYEHELHCSAMVHTTHHQHKLHAIDAHICEFEWSLESSCLLRKR